MTAENFSYYLKNPGHLYQVSYQELKSLVVQYPYCQNLRYLLVTKSQIENSEEYQNDLTLAATYHVDRSYLYQLIHQEENGENTENFVLKDDYLELKDLSNNSEELNEVHQAVLISEQNEEIIDQEDSLKLTNLDAPTTYLTDSNIPQESINEVSNNEIDDEENEAADGDMELTESSDLDIPTSSHPENSTETEVADNISDESEMISYMEKPKKSKSVIEQLLGKGKISKEELNQDGKIISLNAKNEINMEDELESPPFQEENDFKDLTPIKETPRLGKEVLFEITNKTDKEMDALMQKANQLEEEETIDESLGYFDIKEETKNEDSVQPVEAPAPKSSFKSYLDQFQPPVGFIEEIEEETELADAIDEAVKEEVDEEVKILSIKKKKSKKKKKKLMSKNKKLKKKKEKKEKKEKKKKKAKVVAKANKSVQQSDDIVSETLAELLGRQGSRKKAIQMYKRLSLIFPKKSSFFAKKIAKLKK